MRKLCQLKSKLGVIENCQSSVSAAHWRDTHQLWANCVREARSISQAGSDTCSGAGFWDPRHILRSASIETVLEALSSEHVQYRLRVRAARVKAWRARMNEDRNRWFKWVAGWRTPATAVLKN
jgi:hypothetical protein